MTKPIVTEHQLQAARTRAQTSPEAHATFVAMVETLAELRAVVSARRRRHRGRRADLAAGERLQRRAPP